MSKIERFRFSLQVGGVQDGHFVVGSSVTKDIVVEDEYAGAWDVLGDIIKLLIDALRQVLAEATERGLE